MKILVGTVAQTLPSGGRGRYLLQNLGPGKVALNADETATMDNGIVLSVGDVYEFPTSQSSDQVSVIADTAGTDFRFITVGA